MYMALTNFDEENMDDLWGDIWNLNAPEGIKYFMWILAHNIPLTNFSKSRRGLGHTIYNLCCQVSAIAMHIVRECPRAIQVWKITVPSSLSQDSSMMVCVIG